MSFGSNHNYFLYGNGDPVMNLSATIDVTQDIVSNVGFSFQLNAYSPQGANCVWQQYCMKFQTSNGSPGQLYGLVDNWPAGDKGQPFPPPGADLINKAILLLTLPGPTLPAGYKLMICLENETSGNVTGATYVVFDNQGNMCANQTIALLSLNLYNTTPPAPVTSAALAPIVAFQLNLVGPDNCSGTFLSSGAGTITYTASSPLTALSQQPAGCAAPGTFTSETANSVYGDLPASPSTRFTQQFGTSMPPAYGPGVPFAVSQQFGANQTDLFVVDRTGQLVVFSVQGAGHWTSTMPVGPSGLARPGAYLAASQQFGATNQTDVFLIAQNGQLNVFSATGAGPWSGENTSLPIAGPPPIFPSGAYLAASQQFGGNQTDVFLVDYYGQLNVFWVDGAGTWKGPAKIGPKSLALPGAPVAASQQFGGNRTDVFLVDTNGQLNVFWVDGIWVERIADPEMPGPVGLGPVGPPIGPLRPASWNGPEKLGSAGLAKAGAPVAASQQFGGNQTDVFLVDTNGQLNVFWVDGITGSWNEPEKLGPASLAPSGAFVAASQHFGATNQTDVFLIDNNGQLNMFWVEGITGSWNGPEKIGPQGLAAPGAFLAASQQFGATNQTDVFIVNPTCGIGPGWPAVFWVQGVGLWNGPLSLVVQT